MSRRIITKTLQSVAGGPGVDTYSDRVVKYIPSDIVAAWTAASAIIASASNVPTETLFWVAFVVGLIITPLWILKQTGKPAAATQAMVGTGAFLVWVFALGGPFAKLSFYRPLYGSLILILYTLLVGLIQPKE